MKNTSLFAAFCCLVLFGACRSSSGGGNASSGAAASEKATSYRFSEQDSSLVFDGKTVERSEEEWKTLLDEQTYTVLRKKGTECAFTGSFYTNKKQGRYSCAGCGLVLFDSEHKFESGTGWPSFFRPVHHKNVTEHADLSHGMRRVEVVCSRCGGHLGHVFEDGPPPSNLRYCINSAALQFEERKQ